MFYKIANMQAESMKHRTIGQKVQRIAAEVSLMQTSLAAGRIGSEVSWTIGTSSAACPKGRVGPLPHTDMPACAEDNLQF